MTTYAKRIFTLIIIILLIIIGYYYFKQPTLETTTQEPSVTVDDTTSLVGCYIAKLSKDIYILRIESQHNTTVTGRLAYNNFEKDSSSGAFSGTLNGDILIGTYSFDSEGMHSVRQVAFKKVGNTFVQGFGSVKTEGGTEVFEDVRTLSFDSKLTFIKSESCLEHFSGVLGEVTFDYNPFFKALDGNKTPTTDWRSDAKEKGILLARVLISKPYMPMTNFSNATLSIGRSADKTAIKNCVAPSSGVETKGEQVMISGYPFTTFTGGDAGAGNLYETTAYRGIVDGDCYSIEYMIHSVNIGNYSLDQGIKEFNKKALITEFEQIVKSVKFTVSSD